MQAEQSPEWDSLRTQRGGSGFSTDHSGRELEKDPPGLLEDQAAGSGVRRAAEHKTAWPVSYHRLPREHRGRAICSRGFCSSGFRLLSRVHLQGLCSSDLASYTGHPAVLSSPPALLAPPRPRVRGWPLMAWS